MDLLDQPPPLDLNDRTWIVHTRSEERPPVMIEEGAIIRDSLITDGCHIAAGALVERCVLSPGVVVGTNAIVRESIVLTDTVIGAGARVQRAIVDKSVHIGKGARVGGRLKQAEGKPGLGLTTVGKNADIADKEEVAVGETIQSDEDGAGAGAKKS
jgi:glucose-1-phosphate adenylyltransferase